MRGLFKVIVDVFLDVVDDRFVGLFMIRFQGKNVVAFSVHDLLGNLLLGPHGVDRDDRFLQVDQSQQFRNRCDFVGFLISRHLSQCQSLL